MTKKDFILSLHNIGAIKFGEFTLKSGKKSPFYFDLRDMISHPELLKGVAELMTEAVRYLDFDYITGIPYTALPIATLVADALGKPLIYMRKEEKVYGTRNPIIGQFEKGKKCMLVDDLITTGESLLETAEKYKEAGLEVIDFAVILDRSRDMETRIAEDGYHLHSLMKLDEIIAILRQAGRLSAEEVQRIEAFTRNMDNDTVSGEEFENPLTKRLRELMRTKQSNLILSLDVNNQRDFFRILKETAEHIVMLKTHIDILDDFDENFITELKRYADRYNFMLFEDRKFADIGNTVRHQYRHGIYKIIDWANFVTVHAVPGEGILQGLFDGTTGKSGFLLAKMSSKGNLMNDTYTRSVFNIGERHREYVSGYIGHANTAEALRRLKNKIPKGQLLLMPGVKLQKGSDATGQQYTTVEDAIHGGADCIIVGRGIITAPDPGAMAAEYRRRAWQATKLRKQ